MLITEVIDVASARTHLEALSPPPGEHDLLNSLYTIYQGVSPDNCHEALHDAQQLKNSIFESLSMVFYPSKERAYAEEAYKSLIAKVREASRQLSEVPDEIKELDKLLVDLYFCNFSVFQSLPDCWAINQIFPVMPIHRLAEEPQRRGVIADLTCDSDGKIDQFVQRPGLTSYLRLHEQNGKEPYYIGIFLVGAYQETLRRLT